MARSLWRCSRSVHLSIALLDSCLRVLSACQALPKHLMHHAARSLLFCTCVCFLDTSPACSTTTSAVLALVSGGSQTPDKQRPAEDA